MIYFIRNARCNAVKIGYSANPAARLYGLQGSSPCALTLLGVCPGDMQDEKGLHRRFEHLALRHEWFRETPELLVEIAFLCERYKLWGRCPRCGEPNVSLHEALSEPDFVCENCDPPGEPRTLRRSKETTCPFTRVPAGGGYRIIRKNH